MQRGLFLNVVVGEGPAGLQYLTCKHWLYSACENALFDLNLSSNILDAIRRLHLERDGLARERLHEYLHSQRIERSQQ